MHAKIINQQTINQINLLRRSHVSFVGSGNKACFEFRTQKLGVPVRVLGRGVFSLFGALEVFFSLVCGLIFVFSCGF